MKKTLIGQVVSVKMKNTVVVKVERKLVHSKYKKVIIRHKKYKAHNEDLELEIGDMVNIVAIRPMSKDKHFRVTEKLKTKNKK